MKKVYLNYFVLKYLDRHKSVFVNDTKVKSFLFENFFYLSKEGYSIDVKFSTNSLPEFTKLIMDWIRCGILTYDADKGIKSKSDKQLADLIMHYESYYPYLKDVRIRY